jgi:hypothetical protein
VILGVLYVLLAEGTLNDRAVIDRHFGQSLDEQLHHAPVVVAIEVDMGNNHILQSGDREVRCRFRFMTLRS